ncbi:response regulator [Telluribacter sp. SYSU D00476]|uniref:response regulator n=1 Tax=Telluribacter sp. SYSU D00476 TaxID=2811430 RepID=UPI001FF53AD0|nr:response regulator [Telluribacter sp. SYSU D00476]
MNYNRSHILIVEDNRDHWFIIESALKDRLPDVEPVLAINGEEARTYLQNCLDSRANLPKIILLDLYLPTREQGWQLLRELKKEGSPFVQVPVVILSFSKDTNDIAEVYNYGATAYLVKPTDYNSWLKYFETLRQYWWDTVTLPGDRL